MITKKKNQKIQLALVGLLSCAISLFFSPAAVAALKTISTVEQDDVERGDVFVKRGRSDVPAKDYKLGQLGILLPTYEREALFLAYRALTLDRATLVLQGTEVPPRPFVKDEIPGGVNVWQAARRAVTDKALVYEIEQDKSFTGRTYGGYLNCGNSAFNVAASTLQLLTQSGKYDSANVMDWVDAQDKVFQNCGDKSKQAPPIVPTELSSTSNPYLLALRQYQIAAAYFYAGDFAEALRRFDAIAAEKTHPRRAWAELAGMRALLRSASLDNSYALEVSQIRLNQDGLERKRAAFDLAFMKDQRVMDQSFAQIQVRSNKILADNSLIDIHQASTKLVAQAAGMIAPERMYGDLSDGLARFDSDIFKNRLIEKWTDLGDHLFDYKGKARSVEALRHSLRQRHAYFNWIQTIQGCTDNARSPNFKGLCAQEHAHALDMWQASKNRTWLVAALMTAQSPSPALEQAQQSAMQVNSDAMEYLTLRYHMTRLMRQNNRLAEAKTILEPALAQLERIASKSAQNLLRQEAFAVAETWAQALPYLKRTVGKALAVDGDELLNRRLAAEDLLKLAQAPSVDKGLKDQLLIAAWWRANMVGNTLVATTAARMISENQVPVSQAAATYLASSDAKERQLILAKAAMQFRISPQVYFFSRDFGARRKPGPADFWCSFDSADFQQQRKLQRTPEFKKELSENTKTRDAELATLRSLGTGADWLARVALSHTKAVTLNMDPALRPMLNAVVASESLNCASDESERLRATAKLALTTLPATANTPLSREQMIRGAYDKAVQDAQGKLEFNVSHIMFNNATDANAALSSLKAGGSFEDIARAKSTDPGSGKNGGALDWSLAEVYVAPFAAAVRTFTLTSPGLYPLAVQTQFGWHIIRVHGVRPLVMPTFEQARSTIERQLSKELPQR